IMGTLIVGAGAAIFMRARWLAALILFLSAHGAVWQLYATIAGFAGPGTPAFFLLLAASWLLGWQLVSVLSEMRPKNRATGILLRLLIPTLFGAWILILWELIVRGAGIPFVLLPPPSAVGVRIAAS